MFEEIKYSDSELFDENLLRDSLDEIDFQNLVLVSNTTTDSQRQTTRPQTAFNVMKTIIGAGFFFGNILILLLGYLFYWSIMTLVYTAIHTKTSSLQELVDFCFGKKGVIGLNILLFLTAWGAMASYSVIIGDVLPDIFGHIFGQQSYTIPRFLLSRSGMVILATVFILFPVSMAKSLAGLAKFSGVALLAIVAIILSVLVTGPQLSSEYKTSGVPLKIINWSGIPAAISIFSFAYVCQHNILLNYQSLRKRSAKRFGDVAKASMIAAVSMTFCIGLSYITFREKSQSNILNSFPTDNILITICRFLFAFDMFFTYPLELFIARDTLENAFFSKFQPSKTRHLILTTAILLSTLLISLFTCELGLILELSGGATAGLIAFIIPSACWLKSMEGLDIGVMDRVRHWGCICFGVVVMVLTFSLSLYDAFDGTKLKKDCKWFSDLNVGNNGTGV